jgi:hypothetical protein
MAVGAHQGALACFRATPVERLPHGAREPEALDSRVHVVKVEIDEAAVIPAHGAASTCFLDENPFHLLVPSRDRFADAALASPPPRLSWAAAVEREFHAAVMRTSAKLNRAATSPRRPPSSFDPWRE